MDVCLVTDEVSLEPDVPGEVLVDVVNTDDVIDVVQVEVTGVPGAVVQLDGTPTLFPGERRRLPLRVRLPARMPAGRHRMDVLVATSTGGVHRPAALIVDVRPKPVLAAAVRPSVRLDRRRTTFPVTIANRGNTPLLVRLRELDIPDGVTVTFGSEEIRVAPWETQLGRAEVVAPRHLSGAIREHVLDLRVTAWSSTPGQPLLEEELSQDVRVTFRQRALISTGLLLAIVLVLVLAVWGTLGYLGLRKFVHAGAPPLSLADGFVTTSVDPAQPAVGITISGQVVSEVDDSPVPGVTVLACGRDQVMKPAKTCRQKAATAETVSDANGQFWLPGNFPGPYNLRFLPSQADSAKPEVHIGSAKRNGYWYDYSCSVYQRLPGRHGKLTVLVQGPAADRDTSASGDVVLKVEARRAAPDPDSLVSPTPSVPGPSASPAATATAAPTVTPACPKVKGPAPAPAPTVAVTVPTWTDKQRIGRLDDGSFVGVLHLAGLPAPGRYDLRVTAGKSCLAVPATVSAGTKPTVLSLSLPGTCAP